MRPRSCRPYRAQTKGKVERPIRYIRESFFYGRSFANDNDLNEQAVRWLEGTANVRRHATTGERPVDRFERDERVVAGRTRVDLQGDGRSSFNPAGSVRGPVRPCWDQSDVVSRNGLFDSFRPSFPRRIRQCPKKRPFFWTLPDTAREC